MEEYTPIATILPYNGPGRPPLVVSILESMSCIDWSRCFDCVVKDSTRKIGGNIYHKIMIDPKWQRKIVPGIDLILTSIAIFRTTCNSVYMNITIKFSNIS